MARTAGSRNRTSPDSFTQALKDAERKLADTMSRKTAAEKDVQVCNAEIPRLQAIIRALGGTVPADFSDAEVGKYAGKIAHAPGVHEIPDGAGSIPVVNGSGQPGQEKAPDIDTLPGMEGEFQ